MPATIASFKVDFFQFLTPDGHLVSDEVPPLAKDFDELIRLYELMVKTRVFDKKAIALQRTGTLVETADPAPPAAEPASA